MMNEVNKFCREVARDFSTKLKKGQISKDSLHLAAKVLVDSYKTPKNKVSRTEEAILKAELVDNLTESNDGIYLAHIADYTEQLEMLDKDIDETTGMGFMA